LQGINQLLGPDVSSCINLYDESTHWFYEYRAAGPLADYLRGVPPRQSGGTCRHVLDTGQPLYLDDVCDPPPGSPTIRQDSVAHGVRSFAALPLKRGDRVVGMLFVNLQKPVQFSVENKRILELFANQSAIVIENVRLDEDLRRRVRYLDMLNRVAAQVGALPESQHIYETIVQEAKAALEASRCTLFVLDDTDRLRPQATVGVPQDVVGQLSFKLGEGLAGWVAQDGRSILVADVLEDSRYVLLTTTTPISPRSMVLAPLWVEGKVVGVLSADRDTETAFDETDQHFVQILAVQAGILVSQANRRQQRVQAVRMQINPYIVGEPIRDPQRFFGRYRYLQDLVNSIRSNHFIISGERRIGKTSLLLQLDDRLRKINKTEPGVFFLPVFISLQGVHQEYFFDFLMSYIVRAAGISSDKLHWPKADYNHRDFELDLDLVVHFLEEQHPRREIRIVLLLDEMDQFSAYSQDIQSRFRSLLNRPVGTFLKVIMAGVAVEYLQRTTTSPWYNLFSRRMELDTLEESEAQQLVVEPVRDYYAYTSKALRAILNYGDLKPLELQRLASLAVREMLRRISQVEGAAESQAALSQVLIQQDDVDTAMRQALRDKDDEYRERWHNFSPAQRRALLQSLAGGGVVDLRLKVRGGQDLFPRQDLYNIACQKDNTATLTYLFKEWLKGV
jgi:GAF domain-containing protein